MNRRFVADRKIRDWIELLGSYTEVSPSGSGLRTLLFAILPPRDRKCGPVEVYDGGRFLTITGWHLAGSPMTINDLQAELDVFHKETFAERVAKRAAQSQSRVSPSSAPITVGDADLLDRARRARNGSRFAALFDRGEWQSAGFRSQSEADQWLASRLTFWARGDTARADRLFRQSALMRAKWERASYRERTLALAACA